MIIVLSMDEQVIFTTTALMPSVTAVTNLATLPRTVPTKFVHQEHYTTIVDLVRGIDTPTAGGTDNTSIVFQDIGDMSVDYSPALIPTMTETAVLEDTPFAPLQATIVAHANLQLMDAPAIPHTMI